MQNFLTFNNFVYDKCGIYGKAIKEGGMCMKGGSQPQKNKPCTPLKKEPDL